MRSVIVPSVLLASAFLVACGDDGGNGDDVQPDASGASNEGFVAPDSVTKANVDGAEVGDADWSCLNTASTDQSPSVTITLTGVLNDFADDTQEVSDATVTVFSGIDYMNPLDTDGPTAIDGAYELIIPGPPPVTGPRYGFKLTAPDYMDTFLLNQYFDPNNDAQTLNISGISTSVATALPALIGQPRTDGTGVLAGAIRDCQDREVSFSVATVSTTAGSPDHLTGAQTYYLDSGTNLPVRHEQLLHTDSNGLFAVFELPVTATAYVQIWGFVDAADLADGEMTLLSELAAPVVGDTVITGSFEALRN